MKVQQHCSDHQNPRGHAHLATQHDLEHVAAAAACIGVELVVCVIPAENRHRVEDKNPHVLVRVKHVGGPLAEGRVGRKPKRQKQQHDKQRVGCAVPGNLKALRLVHPQTALFSCGLLADARNV